MKVKIITLAVVLILANLSGHTQTGLASGVYSVDEKIDLKLKKFKLVDSGQLKNSMKIKVPWKDQIFFNQSLNCITESFLSNDTIYIIGHMIGELGYGFQLLLFRDSCSVAAFGLSDGQVYRRAKSDTTYSNFIALPSQDYKVVLAKAPSFMEGETIEGFVEINSFPFYYKDLEDEFKIELQAYFKTAAIKRIE